MNVKFEYLYRDASNYKNWGDVIFSNKSEMKIEDIEVQIKNNLIDNQFFIAEHLDIPVLYFEKYDFEVDHNWHEFYAISTTRHIENDPRKRDIINIIDLLKDE